VTRLADTEKHPRVQNRYEHQPEAGRQCGYILWALSVL
jgi:hypothetical protein